MRFSLRAILVCMLIAALLAWSVAQRRELAGIAVRTSEMRDLVESFRQRTEQCALRTVASRRVLNSDRTPSAVFDEATKRFSGVQEKYGRFSNLNRALPTIQDIPEYRDNNADRRRLRLFIPRDGSFAMRLAVFPYSLPGRSKQAETILLNSPFRPAAPQQLHLAPGEHELLTTWSKDRREFVVEIDGKPRLAAHYTRELKSPHKYYVLGGYMRKGELRSDRNSLDLRFVSPVEGETEPKFTLRCQLIRVSEGGSSQ